MVTVALGEAARSVPMAHSAERPTALTDFQVAVARIFFSLPASTDFLLAGGVALVAHLAHTRVVWDQDQSYVINGIRAGQQALSRDGRL